MDQSVHPDIERVLIDEATIQRRVDELAAQINGDYAGLGSLLLVGVLKGAFIFLADLSRRLVVPHSVDFMSVSSYGMAATSGAVRIVLDLRVPVEGQHVILVEDIVDTGKTLQYLQHVLASRNPASLRTAALLRKQRPEVQEVQVEYLGFTIPDVWVVGYGLDYADAHRTLPYIGVLKHEVYA